jgi:hypothetical protein
MLPLVVVIVMNFLMSLVVFPCVDSATVRAMTCLLAHEGEMQVLLEFPSGSRVPR